MILMFIMFQVRHLWRSFIREDERGSGRIGYDRVKAILRALNIYRDKKQLRELFSSLDIHASGTLAFDQFVKESEMRFLLLCGRCVVILVARALSPCSLWICCVIGLT